MKKIQFINTCAAMVIGIAMTGCSHDFDDYDTPQQGIVATYNQAFINAFGQPAANQTWGFGETTSVSTSRITRSQAAPAVPSMTAPYDEAWVSNYNQTAKEPSSANISDNYDNSTYERKADTYAEPYTTWYAEFEAQYPTANYDWNWTKAVAAAQADGWEHFDDLFIEKPDENFVLKFKITGTWNGEINVVASEGLTDGGVATNAERTVVVTGTWNITADQRVGSKGLIVIANGGTVNVAEGKTLNMVNQARLVVLPGGKLTGSGKVEVNNGNASGLENYNGGTIDVATFNNNFGKFFNYGKFLVNEYHGGAQESNFYNRSLVVIDHFGGTGSTANARVFNACQFYVVNNARIRNYEGINGSALIVGGELMFSSSEDGTSTPTYVGLADGALVKCATLYNNGTSWTGPTTGYAALEITNKITYLNWEQDAPQTGGYFENNIYVKGATWDNVPDGNGYHQTDPSDAANYAVSIADYKFFTIVANCRGNGGVIKIEDSANVIWPADDEFVLGTSGCTPGFKGNVPTVDEWGDWKRIICEDLTISGNSDFDFNDAVFDARINTTKTKAQIKLKCAGGTLPLTIGWDGSEDTSYQAFEVHNMYGVATNIMVNTNATNGVNGKADVTKTLTGTFNNFNDIKVMVQKQGVWVEITAHQGEPASKIAVDTDYEWCRERQDIRGKYSNFITYVQENTLTDWWHATPVTTE